MKLAILVALMLAGCTTMTQQVIDQLPSTNMCGDVLYLRHGNQAQMSAICEVPGAHPTMEQQAAPTQPKAA